MAVADSPKFTVSLKNLRLLKGGWQWRSILRPHPFFKAMWIQFHSCKMFTAGGLASLCFYYRKCSKGTKVVHIVYESINAAIENVVNRNKKHICIYSTFTVMKLVMETGNR